MNVESHQEATMIILVRKLGGSVAVVIPTRIAREMNLAEGTPLEIDAQPDKIALRKPRRRPRRTLDELVKQIKPASYRRHRALLAHHAAGNELW